MPFEPTGSSFWCFADRAYFFEIMIINRRFQTPAFKKSSFMQRIFISDANMQTAPNVPELLGRYTTEVAYRRRLLTPRTTKAPFFFLGKQLAYWLPACGRDGGWRRRWWRPSISSERRRPDPLGSPGRLRSRLLLSLLSLLAALVIEASLTS